MQLTKSRCYLLFGILLVCLATLQVKIWWPGTGSYWCYQAIKKQQADICHLQDLLRKRHQRLTEQLIALKKHQGRDEGYLRYHYNWVAPHETLAQFDDK